MGNRLHIRQHPGICWRSNTNSFYIWVLIQIFFHIIGTNRTDQIFLLQPGPLQIDRLQIQQRHGVKHRPMAVPVH